MVIYSSETAVTCAGFGQESTVVDAGSIWDWRCAIVSDNKRCLVSSLPNNSFIAISNLIPLISQQYNNKKQTRSRYWVAAHIYHAVWQEHLDSTSNHHIACLESTRSAPGSEISQVFATATLSAQLQWMTCHCYNGFWDPKSRKCLSWSFRNF